MSNVSDSFIFSDNTLTLTNLDTDTGTVDVYMTNDEAVGGFQFDMSDITITGGPNINLNPS